jgi:hypothetical protein
MVQVFLIYEGLRDVILDFSQDGPLILSLGGDDWLEPLLVVISKGQEDPISNGTLILDRVFWLLCLTVIRTILDPTLNSQVLALN